MSLNNSFSTFLYKIEDKYAELFLQTFCLTLYVHLLKKRKIRLNKCTEYSRINAAVITSLKICDQDIFRVYFW